MQASHAVSHKTSLPLASVRPVGHALEGESIFMLGLLYAVTVSPFIGGVRGWPCTLGWLVPPVLWLWRTGDRSGIGLQKPRTMAPAVGVLIGFVAIGVLTGFGFYLLGFKLPLISQFTLALPSLHRSFVGNNVKLFLALIPVGHFVHELFYRGFLQTRLALRLGSTAPAIVLSALLYAWTHVFIYSSQEFQMAMASLTGGKLAGIQDVQTTLTLVVAFSFVESALAGLALKWTESIFASVAFRSSNLLTVCLLVYWHNGILQ
jgi:membrane protease YdiL (CAAX protease family)